MKKEFNKLFEIKTETSEKITKGEFNVWKHFLSRFLSLFILIVVSVILLESDIMGVQDGVGILFLSAILQVLWFLLVIIELIAAQIKKNYLMRNVNLKLLLAAIIFYVGLIRIAAIIRTEF